MVLEYTDFKIDSKMASYLMVLEFSSHNSEGIVYEMVIDMNFGQPVRGTRWHPLLIQVIVDHDWSPRRGNTLLRSFVTEIVREE